MRIVNKILNFISKRVFIVGFIILIQIIWGISMLTRLTEYSSALNSMLAILSLLVVLYIINKDDNPAYKLAWIIPMRCLILQENSPMNRFCIFCRI